MADDASNVPIGPDLTRGVALAALSPDTPLVGHVEGDEVMLVRRGDEIFAIDARCTHYGANLADGLVVGDTIRCPWHHACFSLRTGAAVRAPAVKSAACWKVETLDEAAPGEPPHITVRVREKLAPNPPIGRSALSPPRVVIIGGGAAGASAAETLRREGYAGRITLLSADDSVPYDRPGLSKGYLYGDTPEADVPLRSAAFYEAHDIELKLNARVDVLDTAARQVRLADGQHYDYDAVLLATGSEPVRLDIPGADLPQVCYLRTLTDARSLLARAAGAKRAVVIGSSFIGLEVAASLRKREIEVHVVAPETVPMKKIFGAEVGDFIRRLHERHGVTFHLETEVTSIDEWGVMLKNGGRIDSDLIVVGVGVKPSLGLAERAGLTLDHGVLVDPYLQTSVAGVYAAGDIARWPDRLSGQAIRVEHWAVAQRQGQTAARNMLGAQERFDAVPFFWSEQYDFAPQYIGHAETWDSVQIDGDLETMDCEIRYVRDGQDQAVVMIARDLQGLRTERVLEGRVAATEGVAA